MLLVFWVAATLLLEMGCASVASCCYRLQWVTVSSFTVILGGVAPPGLYFLFSGLSKFKQ